MPYDESRRRWTRPALATFVSLAALLTVSGTAAQRKKKEEPIKPARLEIETERAGCAVDVDSQPAGETDAQGALALSSVEPGNHYLHIRCPSSGLKTYFVSPLPDETVTIQHPPAIPAATSESEDSTIEPAEIQIRLRQHMREGIQLRARGRIEEAIHHLRNALKLDPANSDLHREIGITFLVGKEWKGARVEMLEAVRLDPDDAEAHNGLGYALEKLGDLKTALEEYRIAARLEPGDQSYRRRYLARRTARSPDRGR